MKTLAPSTKSSLSPEASYFQSVVLSTSADWNEEVVLLFSASLVMAPRAQVIKANALLLASARLIGQRLLNLIEHGTPEQLKDFQLSYPLSTCVSFYCQLIAANWDLISTEDWSCCSLQDVCESL